MEYLQKSPSVKRSAYYCEEGTPQKYRKSENAPQSGNDTMIEHRIAGDDPGVFRVWDRRINGYIFDEQSSLYSLLRAWVQDDPDRPLYHEKGLPTSDSFVLSTHSTTDYDKLIEFLHSQLTSSAPRNSDISHLEDSVNSLPSISHNDILSLHVLHGKKIKRMWKMLAAARYGREKVLHERRIAELATIDDETSSTGGEILMERQTIHSHLEIPPSDGMERILAVPATCDFSLMRLRKELLSNP